MESSHSKLGFSNIPAGYVARSAQGGYLLINPLGEEDYSLEARMRGLGGVGRGFVGLLGNFDTL